MTPGRKQILQSLLKAWEVSAECGWHLARNVNVGHHISERLEIKIYRTQLPASGYANLKPIIFNCTE
jgi:hypothetical protein